MNWFFIALLSPALWAISNHADKLLVERYFKNAGMGTLLIFTALITFVIAPIVFVLNPTVLVVSPLLAAIMMSAGVLYIIAILPYFLALRKDEASRVVPLFQLAPIFGYLLGLVFLRETLSGQQIAAALIIIAGAFLLSLEIERKNFRFKGTVFGLMALSSFLFSSSSLVFKAAAVESAFWTTVFWQYLGSTLAGLALWALVPAYRRDFNRNISLQNVPILGLVGFSESLSILGRLLFSFATLLAPLALVLTVNGFQPLFVFLYGVILTLFFPKLGQESLAKRHIAQKLLAIAVMFLGTYLLFR